MLFRIEDSFWSLFPQARIGVVIARNIRNQDDGASAAVLQQAVDTITSALPEDMATHPAVAPWREAYRAFGMKPAKFRSSIENLLRSARSGGVRSINPLVDLYNAISLKYLLPCGGEDLAAIHGDIRLTRAVGDEHFISLGSTEVQPPQPGEIIYRDDIGVICRSWNWREADRTKLTETTTDAFLCIESLPPITEDTLRAACEDLAALVQAHLGGTVNVYLLNTVHNPLIL